MRVVRIVTNIESSELELAASFYQEILGLELLMDYGWIQTYGSDVTMPLQISIASEGGSGMPVPDLSIEVDDLDEVFQAVEKAGHQVVYGPVKEPWGVSRFFVQDPFGKLLNIMQHC